jgi:hypothetical protein
VLVDPRLFGHIELRIFFGGVVLVGLKPSDLVHLSLVWGSACAWASAAASAATSTSATTFSSGVTAPAAASSCAAKLGNAAHVGRVLLKVMDKVGKQCQTFCEGLVVGLNRQKHLLEEDIMRRSDSTYVDLILHARMRRSNSSYVDPIPRARMCRSNSTYVDPILHTRLGIAGIQNRIRGAENKANSEQ